MNFVLRIGLVLIIGVMAALYASWNTQAREYRLGDLVIDSAFAPPSIGAARAGAAYFVVRNTGAEPDRLIDVRTDISARTELHTHTHESGIMRMRKVDGGIVVGAGETVTLAPGGLHVMLMGLSSPLEAQSSFPLTLVFERSGEVTLDVTVSQGAREKAPHTH